MSGARRARTAPPDAVILAAGNGARLSPLTRGPKCLLAAAGLPLLDHIVGSLVTAGIERIHIVTGHRGDTLRSRRFACTPPGGIGFIHNERHREPNGLSVLAAESYVASPFLLLMADHLFELDTLTRFLDQSCPRAGGLLAVDRKLDRVFDLPDATKVLSPGGRLRAIGKQLGDYDAVDTGLFLFSNAIFPALRRSVAQGNASLTGAVAALCAAGTMATWDVGGAAWIDVDTPQALEEAERLARRGLLGCPQPMAAAGT